MMVPCTSPGYSHSGRSSLMTLFLSIMFFLMWCRRHSHSSLSDFVASFWLLWYIELPKLVFIDVVTGWQSSWGPFSVSVSIIYPTSLPVLVTVANLSVGFCHHRRFNYRFASLPAAKLALLTWIENWSTSIRLFRLLKSHKAFASVSWMSVVLHLFILLPLLCADLACFVFEETPSLFHHSFRVISVVETVWVQHLLLVCVGLVFAPAGETDLHINIKPLPCVGLTFSMRKLVIESFHLLYFFFV